METKEKVQTGKAPNKKKEKPYIFRVATKPDISSYKWIGKEFSILSFGILWFVWVCRFLSLYQHIKAIFRQIQSWRGAGTTSNKSGRPDIPPIMGEIYFILWTAFFALRHVFGWDNLLLRGISVYYLFETVTWILYYTVFRRFFELGYSIYHKLEYLTTIILLIPTQALCMSYLYGMRFRDMLRGLLGSASDSTPFGVAVLGCVFSAIVISMIISTFPMEAIKKKDSRAQMSIIGCGDVVQKRLYPALQKSNTAKMLRCYDLDTVEERQGYCDYCGDAGQICRAVEERMDEKEVIWIETPPFAHLEYLEHFLQTRADLIVVEKPAAVCKDELARIESLIENKNIRNRVFFLSYYILEKALPLYYLTSGKEAFEKYLDIENSILVNTWHLMLGAPQCVQVHIAEGADTRAWVRDHAYGGQKVETLLHNVLIAALFCGSPDGWQDVRYSEREHPGGMLELHLDALRNKTDIHLSLKKNAPPEQLGRTARITFTGGTLQADFDKQEVEIFFNSMEKSCKVAVKDAYLQRYGIMVDLVDRVMQGEYQPCEVDGLGDQLNTIRWLLELK